MFTGLRVAPVTSRNTTRSGSAMHHLGAGQPGRRGQAGARRGQQRPGVDDHIPHARRAQRAGQRARPVTMRFSRIESALSWRQDQVADLQRVVGDHLAAQQPRSRGRTPPRRRSTGSAGRRPRAAAARCPAPRPASMTCRARSPVGRVLDRAQAPGHAPRPGRAAAGPARARPSRERRHRPLARSAARRPGLPPGPGRGGLGAVAGRRRRGRGEPGDQRAEADRLGQRERGQVLLAVAQYGEAGPGRHQVAQRRAAGRGRPGGRDGQAGQGGDAQARGTPAGAGPAARSRQSRRAPPAARSPTPRRRTRAGPSARSRCPTA